MPQLFGRKNRGRVLRDIRIVSVLPARTQDEYVSTFRVGDQELTAIWTKARCSLSHLPKDVTNDERTIICDLIKKWVEDNYGR